MPYFKDTAGGLHFLSDADIINGGKSLMPTGCVEIPDDHAARLIPQTPPVGTEWLNYQNQAKQFLEASDKIVLRCYENSLPVPENWVKYRSQLRSILKASSGDASKALPKQPAKPAEL
jgi:hypothetical protein